MEMKNSRLYILTVILVTLLVTFKFLPGHLLTAGKSQFKNGNYIKAHNSLSLGLKLQPYNKDMRYYYVKTLTKFRSTFKVQKKIFEFSESKQNDSAKTLAATKISGWKFQILKQFGNSYIEQAPYDKKILHWDINTFPLKVYIPNTTERKLPNYYVSEIKNSFYLWQKASGFVSFVYVNNPKKADIIIEFATIDKTNCNTNGCKYVVAYTVPKIKNNRLKQMVITIYDKDPYGNYLSNKELHNTVLHEIGHSLGIMGHSYNTNDLMYMSTNQNQINTANKTNFMYLTSNDINTIKLLYKLVPDITNVPQSEINTSGMFYAPIILGNANLISTRKLIEAQNYVEKAPNISGGYIDLGIAYAELGKISEAIEALNKAEELATTDNERAIAYYNLAVVSMNNKKYKDAFKYAEISKNILPTEEINELLTAIRQYLKLGTRMPVSNYLTH